MSTGNLFTPRLGAVGDQLMEIYRSLLSPMSGLTLEQCNQLREIVSDVISEVAQMTGSMSYYEQTYGSFRDVTRALVQRELIHDLRKSVVLSTDSISISPAPSQERRFIRA